MTNHLILVVDDEVSNLNLMAQLLQSSNYSVLTANDGFKAVAACRVKIPDLIILDVEMPLINGIEVRKMLKSDERTNEIPIIFLDSKANSDKLINKNNLSHQEVLYKPFDPSDLLARIEFAIENRRLKRELVKSSALKIPAFDETSLLKNEVYLKEFLKINTKQAKRYKSNLTILAVGIDNFINLKQQLSKDELVLLMTELGISVAQMLRDSDVISLNESGDYTIVLTHTDLNGAKEVANRILNNIVDSIFEINQKNIKITVSIGICQYIKEMNDNYNILLSHAKIALKTALSQSGNTIKVSD